MPDELMDIVDENDTVNSTALRSTIYKSGTNTLGLLMLF